MQLTPIKRSLLYESAVDQIRSLILADNYKPGDRLPSERELAEKLSIGRPSVREALRILGAMGSSRSGRATGPMCAMSLSFPTSTP
jgi:GntR family transcriptional repressor for pyruvate dehydrogenase complex